MRAEVLLLTRNIQIVGSNDNGWGGQILTSDYLEADGETMRIGITILSNVEIYNCSQRDTYKAALRFENAKLGSSKVTDCTIH